MSYPNGRCEHHVMVGAGDLCGHCESGTQPPLPTSREVFFSWVHHEQELRIGGHVCPEYASGEKCWDTYNTLNAWYYSHRVYYDNEYPLKVEAHSLPFAITRET